MCVRVNPFLIRDYEEKALYSLHAVCIRDRKMTLNLPLMFTAFLVITIFVKPVEDGMVFCTSCMEIAGSICGTAITLGEEEIE